MKPQPSLAEPDAVLKARIVLWNAKKGFGFLQVGKERVFLHRRDFAEHFKKPEFGDRIRFTLGQDDQGRRCARNAVHDSRVAGISVRSLFFFPVLLPLPMGGLMKLGLGFKFTISYLILLNVLTYWVYARDKRAARTGARRTPEIQMHLLEFSGGWPAAFFAQRKLAHKRSKGIYKTVFQTIVLSHQIVALDYLCNWHFSRYAVRFLQSLSVNNLF